MPVLNNEDLTGFRLPVNLHAKPHFLNQISEAAYYHRDNRQLPVSVRGERPRLHVCVSIVDVKSIDLVNETFSCKLRIYAMWEEDLSEATNLASAIERAKQSEEYKI